MTYRVRVFNARRDAGEMVADHAPAARWVWGKNYLTGDVGVSPSNVDAEKVGVPGPVVAELVARLSTLPVNAWTQVGPAVEDAKRPARAFTQEELRDLKRDEAAMRRYARGVQREEAEWLRSQKRDNPLSGSAWAWLAVGAVGLVGAVVMYREKQKAKTWSCRAAMTCTHFTKTNKWQARSNIDNSLDLHDTAPDNLKDLVLEITAPDYKTYTLTKPAVMTEGLPEFLP